MGGVVQSLRGTFQVNVCCDLFVSLDCVVVDVVVVVVVVVVIVLVGVVDVIVVIIVVVAVVEVVVLVVVVVVTSDSCFIIIINSGLACVPPSCNFINKPIMYLNQETYHDINLITFCLNVYSPESRE